MYASRAITGLLLLTWVGCGGDDGPSGLPQCESEWDMQDYAELCAPDFDGCNTCPPDALCEAGTIEGNALTGGTVDNFGSHNAICTTPCDTDADCEGLDFVSNNGYADTEQLWRCASIDGRKLCAVMSQYQSSGSGGCNDACLDTCTVGASCIDICCS